MPSHFRKNIKSVGTCKYCGEEVYGFEEWKIELTDWMEQHIIDCKRNHREKRINKLLGKS